MKENELAQQARLVNSKEVNKVLVFYCGGMLEMQKNEDFNSYFKRFESIILNDSNLVDPSSTHFFQLEKMNNQGWLVSPISNKIKQRVARFYQVYFKLIPVDILNLSIFDKWKKLANIIFENYKKATGFVIISNLRYLPHISSGLSYSFENLSKPVIITSGLRQIYSCNNDSSPNVSGALLLAGYFQIPEVCVFSNGKLFRGNRVTRKSCNKTSAFCSPNYPPLAIVDSEITIFWDRILNLPFGNEEFSINAAFNENVSHLLVTPELNDAKIDQVYSIAGSNKATDFKRQGVIMESFGNGNIRHESRLAKIIGEFKTKNCLTFNVTQCHSGSVLEFEMNSGVHFGAISCGDLVPPAAFAKVSHILAEDVILCHQDLTLEEIEFLLNDCSKGDISKKQKIFKGKEGTIIHNFENLLKDYSGSNFRMIIDEWLLPNLFFSTIKENKLVQMKELLQFDPKLVEAKDHQENTVFHVLASSYPTDEALSLVASYFSKEDEISSVINSSNLFECTPLNLAIKLRKRRQYTVTRIILYYKNLGAQMNEAEVECAKTDIIEQKKLTRAAINNDLELIMLYFFSGFENLNEAVDVESRNIGHIAAFMGFVSIIVFLKNETKFDFFAKDSYGKTPYDEAKEANHENIVDILEIKQPIAVVLVIGSQN